MPVCFIPMLKWEGGRKCSRLVKNRQVFMTRRLYSAPTSGSNEFRDFCFSSTGGMRARFSSFSVVAVSSCASVFPIARGDR